MVCFAAATYAGAQTNRLKSPPRAASATTSTPSAVTRDATRETLAAKSLNGTALPYRVLLPVDYATSTRRYPVLYLLHGRSGNENDWITKTNLSAYAARYPLIIVMPGVGDSWYANSATDKNARYEDAIIRDLIPHIDSTYRTVASRHARAIAGLSMGGLGAMKFALRYPQMFVFAASFSGAFDIPRAGGLDEASSQRAGELSVVYGLADSETRRQNDLFLLLEGHTKARPQLPYLYIASGTNDPLPVVLLSNPRFADALRAAKFAYEFHERPGGHDWRFWDEEIKRMLERMREFVALEL